MALLGDKMDEEMMNIINSGTQFISNDNEQENTDEVNTFEYVAIISFVCTTYSRAQNIFIFVYSPLNR
jgi:hypothetical protein